MPDPIPRGELPQPSEFVRTITSRFPHINGTDASAFEANIGQYGPPEGFFLRLAHAHQFLDREVFADEITKMATRVSSMTADYGYDVIIPRRESSNMWILQQLLQRGTPIPRKIYNLSVEVQEPEWENDPSELDVFMFDDIAISGAQIGDSLRSKITAQSERTVHVLLLHATQEAEKYISMQRNPLHDVSVQTIGKPIKLLTSVLPEGDIDFLKTVHIKSIPSGKFIEPFEKDAAVFGMWYKVPDTYPDVLTGGEYGTLPPLYRSDSIVPPYRTR